MMNPECFTGILVMQADADDEDAAKAILQGLKDRHEKTGKVPSLIHTVSNVPLLF